MFISAIDRAHHSVGPFFACLKTTLIAIALLPCAMAIASTQDQVAYRVAGIIDAGSRVIALVESTSGSQKLYRLGELIDDWEVTEIDAEGITVSNNGRELRLPLRGKAVALVAAPVADEVEPLEFRTASKTARFPAVLQKLNELEYRARSNDSELTFEDINRVLGLPARTRIHKVDEAPVTSPTAFIDVATNSLVSGMAFRLTVSEHTANEIYMTPAADR